jgi:hypothetical protein
MNPWPTLLTITLLSTATAHAGDYVVTVSDGVSCNERVKRAHKFCNETGGLGYACGIQTNSPLVTSKTVIEDLKRYFSGKETRVSNLEKAFLNWHLDFCSKKEKEAIANVLEKIRASSPKHNKDKIAAFLKAVGR